MVPGPDRPLGVLVEIRVKPQQFEGPEDWSELLEDRPVILGIYFFVNMSDDEELGCPP